MADAEHISLPFENDAESCVFPVKEVAELLATGIIRLRLENSQLSGNNSDYSLKRFDSSRVRSINWGDNNEAQSASESMKEGGIE